MSAAEERGAISAATLDRMTTARAGRRRIKCDHKAGLVKICF